MKNKTIEGGTKECIIIYMATEIKSIRQRFEEGPPHAASSHGSSTNNHNHGGNKKLFSPKLNFKTV
jgi:hypothetical protein